MTKTVTRRRVSPMAAKLVQYLTLQKQVKDTNKMLADLKGDLTEFTEKHHEKDPEKGHMLHTLAEGVDFLGQRYSGFMRQRKTSQVFLEDKAQALCEKKGFDPDEYTTRYVDQDKVVRLYAEDRISEAEFNRLYETTESWAFVPVKE
jgi:hypothetical protein